MSRVKIVATIGPPTCSPNSLRAMYEAGMDIARLNGSHADLEWHGEVIVTLRGVLPDVPILLDIPGHKIRLGPLERDLSVDAGERVVLSTKPGHTGSTKVSVTHAEMHLNAAVGDVLLANEGRLRLTISGIDGPDVTCLANSSGILKSGGGIHVRGAFPRSETLSERDRQLIAFACDRGVDFVGVSLVESPANVETVRSLIGGPSPAIVSKIESQGGLDHLSEVVAASDALMIDRGDLSLETSFENVVLHQKRILAEARRFSCPVIVATEMLESMMDSPVPSKADLSDITYSVLDGAAALMLSGETAAGNYPVDAVGIMRKVADVASGSLLESTNSDGNGTMANSVPEAIRDAIALICQSLEVTKIVAITISGYAARMVAAKTPRQPVLAVSNDAAAARRFNLLRGTKGVYVDVPFSRTNMNHVPRCLEELWKRGELQDEDLILVTALSYPKSGNRMNLIETHKVSDLIDSLGWQ